MAEHASTRIPTVLFGAFDRHNFGDLLLAQVVARMLAPTELRFAGLAARDLRSCGGHRVSALTTVASGYAERAVNFVHVGGELLTCDAWEAAVMLAPPDQVQQAIASRTAWAQDKPGWARSRFGSASLAPYALSREMLPRAAQVIYHAVGGVDLDARDPDLRTEVLAKLEAADDVSVRDSQTRSLLEAAGLAARLMPDPAVMVRELFGEQIRRHLIQSAVAPLAQAFPRGYVAVQFSADFGDDETLREIAAQLDRFARSSGLGVVFFRAGAAPWHDELDCYERTLVYMQVRSAAIFESLNLWDICALLAASRAYCGSSLHGRIVTMAFALPRVNLAHPALTQPPAKQVAYAATWENPTMPATVEVGDIARGLHDALAVDQAQLERTAQQQVIQYREGFELIRARLRQQPDPPAMNAAR